MKVHPRDHEARPILLLQSFYVIVDSASAVNHQHTNTGRESRGDDDATAEPSSIRYDVVTSPLHDRSGTERITNLHGARNGLERH